MSLVSKDEFGKVAFASLIPGAVTAVGYAAFFCDMKASMDWWNVCYAFITHSLCSSKCNSNFETALVLQLH